MELRTDVIDVWVFRRGPDGVRYLLLHTSQEKADRGPSFGSPSRSLLDQQVLAAEVERIQTHG